MAKNNNVSQTELGGIKALSSVKTEKVLPSIQHVKEVKAKLTQLTSSVLEIKAKKLDELEQQKIEAEKLQEVVEEKQPAIDSAKSEPKEEVIVPDSEPVTSKEDNEITLKENLEKEIQKSEETKMQVKNETIVEPEKTVATDNVKEKNQRKSKAKEKTIQTRVFDSDKPKKSDKPRRKPEKQTTAPKKRPKFDKTIATPPPAPVADKKFKKKNNKQNEERKVQNKRSLMRKGYNSGRYNDDSETVRRYKKQRPKKNQFIQPKETKIEKAVMTSEFITIKALSEKIGKPVSEILKQLMLLNILKTINDSIDFDTADLVAGELGVKLEYNPAKTAEDKLLDIVESEIEKDENSIERPPIVTIMGHVDHGKTSLLDYIRKSSVVVGEAGGITQHIGAYTIKLNKKPITFLDTPGHEAFTSMRLRGAKVTDIAVIVVAADDGIMPQTVEAINHAKLAGVSIIIAVNKIDKSGVQPEKVLQQLTQYDIVPEEWGGDTPVVYVSAKTGKNVNNLLETILLMAEMLELKANPEREARGSIIEAKLDKGKGPIATVLVQNGTLHVGDFVVAGVCSGKIRAMFNDKGSRINEAGPSIPVAVLGFSDVPNAGDQIMVVSDDKFAKQIIGERQQKVKDVRNATKHSTSLDDIFAQIQKGEVKTLNIIVKGDVQGSVEAVKQALLKLSDDEVTINIIHCAVGAINESDVMLATTSSAVIIGFNVRADSKAKAYAERENIDIRLYRIIYDAIEDVQKAIKGMLDPQYKDTLVGTAEIRQIYNISGVGKIAGAYVLDGKIIRNAKIHLYRDDKFVYEGVLNSLKRFKDDVKEVSKGYECGFGIENYNDIKEGDIIEAYITEQDNE